MGRQKFQIKQKKEYLTQRTATSKLFAQRKTKEKSWKRVKKAYRNYRIPIKETICKLLEFQKEKKVRRGKII